MSVIDQYFDRVFIINLDERQDRWDQIVTNLRKLNIRNYERVSAIKPTKQLVVGQQNWMKTFQHLRQHGLNGHDTSERYALGCLGCKLSHSFVLQMTLQRGYNRVLILEDDAELFDHANDSFAKVVHSLQELPEEWNFLYFMANHNQPPTQVSEHLVRTNFSFTTGAYAVQKHVIPTLLDLLQKDVEEIDVTYSKLQPHISMYCCWPHLGRQRPGYSDIRGQELDYSVYGT